MSTTKFPAERLRNVLYEDEGVVVRDTITDTSRWSVHHELIFKLDGKLWQTHYSEGATEYQDERPFEHESEVLCTEVIAKKVTVVDFVPLETSDR